MKTTFTLGLIQMNCSTNRDSNLEKSVTHIREAARRGAQIVALPELFLSPYFCQEEKQVNFSLAEPVPGPTVANLTSIAKQEKLVIIAPLFEKVDKQYFNTVAVIDNDGSYLGKYRKLHIPDDLEHYYGEAFYFSPGNLGCPVFQTRVGKIATMICWDQWFPESARKTALQGAELIIYPTAIGKQNNGSSELNADEQKAWQCIQQSHAIANGVFVAAVNRVGQDDHLDFWGSSFVADPLGKIIGQASGDKEETLIVSCSRRRIAEVRKDWPFHHALRNDVY
jgi:N-carbamoylputrescine amidase